jgi:hypothetical protein
MGVPNSEDRYSPATHRREDHEVHKGHVVALGVKFFFRKSWDNVETFCRNQTGHIWEHKRVNVICYRHTRRICFINYFSTATAVTRTRFNINVCACIASVVTKFYKKDRVNGAGIGSKQLAFINVRPSVGPLNISIWKKSRLCCLEMR